jgi:hypothetical protein
VLVLPVGEQDGVLHFGRLAGEQVIGHVEPGADGGSALGAQPGHGRLGLRPGLWGGGHHPRLRRVDHPGVRRAGDDREGHSVAEGVDGDRGGPLRLLDLRLGSGHRTGGVDHDHLRRAQRAGVTPQVCAGGGDGDDRVHDPSSRR